MLCPSIVWAQRPQTWTLPSRVPTTPSSSPKLRGSALSFTPPAPALSARAGLLLAALIARSSSPRARRSRARCWSCAAMPSGSPTLSRHWGRWWLPSRWFWGLLSCNLFSSCSLLLVTVWPAVCLVSRSFHPFTLFFFDSMLSLPRLW